MALSSTALRNFRFDVRLSSRNFTRAINCSSPAGCTNPSANRARLAGVGVAVGSLLRRRQLKSAAEESAAVCASSCAGVSFLASATNLANSCRPVSDSAAPCTSCNCFCRSVSVCGVVGRFLLVDLRVGGPRFDVAKLPLIILPRPVVIVRHHPHRGQQHQHASHAEHDVHRFQTAHRSILLRACLSNACDRRLAAEPNCARQLSRMLKNSKNIPEWR